MFGLFLIMTALLVAGWWLARAARPRPLTVALRIAVVALLFGALANPVRPGTPAATPAVLLVDQSASLPQAQRTAIWRSAQAAAAQLGPFRPVRVAAFGADAALATSDQPPAINPDGTDIAGGLRLAGGLLPTGGDVVIISDGGSTTDGAAAEALRFKARGITLHAAPITATVTDVRIESLRVPPALREGERFSADVVIASSAAGQARLEITSDGAPLAARTVPIQAGRTAVSFQTQAAARGFHRFAATITADTQRTADAQPANNHLEAWTIVGLPPRVLVVERAPDSAAALRDALEGGGLVTEAIRPAGLSASLAQLEAYDAIVLQDVPATALSLDQQLAIREFVRSLGHGLVVLGGSNSYSLGGYKNTPLEEVLPVSMEPPPRRERPTVSLLLIIDRSASMLGRPGEDKFSLAKAAAIAATESLGQDDTIGVLTFDNTPDWAVNFTKIGTGAQLGDIQTRIADIASGGGTNIYVALEEGLNALRDQNAPVRHAVLLTDGRSGGEQSYEALIAPLRAQGITLSTIAIGADADQPLLESLAKLGAGRYHFADSPDELPRLTLQETEIARDNPLAEGTVRANLATPHPAIRGLDVGAMPQLEGYVALTPKDEAEQLLTAPEGDVLLATWQYGLGRATAWTSDAGERWTANWPRWAGWGPLMAQIIAATYPDAAAGPLRLSAVAQGAPGAGRATITLDALSDQDSPIDLADVGLRIIGPDGGESIIRADQVGPGRYQASASLPAEGAYQILAALQQGGRRYEAGGGVVRPYSAEWAAHADPDALAGLAAATGGLVAPLATLVAPESGGLAAAQPMRPPRAWWPWLVGAALLLWLGEIAVRRGWIGGR